MSYEQIRQTAKVDRNHRVVLDVPSLTEGTEVQVIITPMTGVSENLKRMARLALREDETGQTEPFPA